MTGLPDIGWFMMPWARAPGHDQAPTASADGDAIPSCADQAGQDAEGGDTVLVASHQPV